MFAAFMFQTMFNVMVGIYFLSEGVNLNLHMSYISEEE